MNTKRTKRDRAGFTLVELIVVISIIGILAALLIPAVVSAKNSASLAIARQEISQLESAVTAFKAKFGVEPPSGLTIYETGASWQADPRSISTMRRIWPQYDFSGNYDINGNGNTTDVLSLDGAECLVFFLGGMIVKNQTPTGVKYQCVGFSSNITTPFAPLSASQSRVGPFFEFSNSRFQDIDADGFLEYRDRLGEVGADPIVYYSMYEGAGFVAQDQYVSPKCGTFAAYQSSMPPVAPATGPITYHKSQSFQIVAPGWDGTLGIGGYYDPQNAVTSLAVGRPTLATNSDANGKGELDNLTNFVGGQMKDGAQK